MSRIRLYFSYLKACKRQLAIGIGCGILYGASSGAGIPFFMQEVFQRVFEDTQTQYKLWEIIAISSLLPLIFAVRGLASYANQYFMNHCGNHVLFRLREDLFGKLNTLSMSYYDRHLSGDLMSRVGNDTLHVQGIVLDLASESIRQPATILTAFGTLCYLSWRHEDVIFLFVLMAVTAATVIPVRLVGRQLKRRGKQVQETQGAIMQQLHENLNAVTEVRAYNLEERQQKRFLGALREFFTIQMKLVKYEKIMQPLMEFIGALVVAAAFAYAYKSGLSFSIFLSLGLALYFCIDAIKRSVRLVNHYQKTTGSFQRLEEILYADNSVTEPAEPCTLQAARGDILFENVQFGYSEEQILRDISLHIPEGEVCALVGPSGAGKSTLAKLVPRFYDVNAGTVRLDGENIRNLSTATLRRHIGIVPQKPVLFDDTLYNNILLGKPEASEAEVHAAARAAHADEFIRTLPEGYQSVAGQDGMRLSGGQRQRIALARAFLKNAPVLILDEATSSLDSESEAKIQAALETLVKGKTVIIIAHRFSTIRLANRIAVMESGRLRAVGTHEEMLERDALYQRLYREQIIQT